MIEIISFLLGLGFSLVVYFRSIGPADIPRRRKLLYFTLSTIGITGTLWLSGILIANTLPRLLPR